MARTGSRRPGRILGVAVLGAIGVAVGACGESSDGDPASATATPPVIPSGAGAPGTPLGDGFTVVEGTTLVGDPIPIGVAVVRNGQPILDEGWTATSVVDGGDPVAIVDAYMGQADRAGLIEQRGTGCTMELDVDVCSAFARSPEGAEPRSVSATVVRGRREDVLSDHVILRYSTTDISWDHGQRNNGQWNLTAPAPATWPPLVPVGEPLGTAGETRHSVVVQEGSRLAAPAHLNLDDATGGIVAMFEVTGDPRSVLQAYLDHLTDLGLDTSTPQELEIGDAIVTSASPSEAGGDHFTLTLVERSGRPTWLVIEGSHD